MCLDCFCVDKEAETIDSVGSEFDRNSNSDEDKKFNRFEIVNGIRIDYRVVETTDGEEMRDFKDNVFEQSCKTNDNNKPLPKPKALPHLTWIHFPKCGSSFTNVFYNYGCQNVEGSGVFTELDDPFLPTYKEETCEYCYNACKGCFTLWAPHDGIMHVKRNNTFLKLPFREKYCVADKRGYIPGHNALTKSRAISRSGTIAAIFRDPRTRLVSAYNYRKHTFGMNKVDREHLLQTTRTVESFANFPGVSSCQTKMLVGYTCGQYVDVNENHLERAKAVVSKHLALGGVLEHWNASVCLFHRKFGGPMHESETANLRPTGKTVNGHLEVNTAAKDASHNSRERLLHDAETTRLHSSRLHNTYMKLKNKEEGEEEDVDVGGRRGLLEYAKKFYKGDDDETDDRAPAEHTMDRLLTASVPDDRRLSFSQEESSYDSGDGSAWEEVPGEKDQVSKKEYLKVTRAHEPYDWELYNFVEDIFFTQLKEYGLEVPLKRALRD
eukprot:m.211081 g.211081  ORF g.211081 m.211081 type:complete len:495 (-) comp13785_c0_seq1:199-1683(-)